MGTVQGKSGARLQGPSLRKATQDVLTSSNKNNAREMLPARKLIRDLAQGFYVGCSSWHVPKFQMPRRKAGV